MLIARAAVQRMIPHAGDMCLLAGAREVDAGHVLCVATSHRDARNPLRRRDCLPAVCGIEYASQAMALHGAWTHAAAENPRPGMLVSVREASWDVQRLDDVAGEMLIEATLERATRMAHRIVSLCAAATIAHAGSGLGAPCR